MDILEVHLWILIVTAVAILISDYHGHAYVRGTMLLLPKRRMQWLHRIVWIGLLGMIGTGLYMAYPALSYYLAKPAFIVKMGFVAVLVINATLIGKLLSVASERPFAVLTADEKKKLFISGALSSICWVGAATIGLFFLS